MSSPLKWTALREVEKHLGEKARNNDRSYNHFHPSQWDVCHRQIAYAYYEEIGAIKTDSSVMKVDPQLERIFDNGHYMHARWRDYFTAAMPQRLRGKWLCLNFMGHDKPKIYGEDDTLGITKPESCECGCTRLQYEELGFYDEETNWGGHVDAILEISAYNGDGTEFMVVDFKSMNPFEFKRLAAPKPMHKTQMQIYLYLSGLKLGRLLYEDKGTQGVKEFDVPRDDNFLAIKKEEAMLLKHRINHLNSNGQRVLPPRAFISAGQRECLQCKFRAHCWKK